jgi:hypothetical protein
MSGELSALQATVDVLQSMILLHDQSPGFRPGCPPSFDILLFLPRKSSKRF